MNTGPARSYGIRIGADVGGTFTDVVLIDATGSVHSRKVPSTPPNFQKAVIEAVGTLLGQLPEGRVSQVAHGTTSPPTLFWNVGGPGRLCSPPGVSGTSWS